MHTQAIDWNPPRRRRVYLVRHGDVTYFDEHGKPFRPDLVPLNENGRDQAKSLAREFVQIPVDRAVSSDLPRCTETAAIITAERKLPVEKLEALREVKPGRLADLPPEEALRSFVGAFGAFQRDSRFLGGETFGALADRVLPCVAELLADVSWQNLLVVAHGGVNRVILAHAISDDLCAFGAFEQDPCCVNILDIDDAGHRLIRLVNATPYNPMKHELNLTTMERLYEQYRAGRV